MVAPTPTAAVAPEALAGVRSSQLLSAGQPGANRPNPLRTCVPMIATVQEFQHPSGPLAGRVILLLAAYAPVAVIAGLRGLPSTAGKVALGLGLIGIALWISFLWWLRDRGPRTRDVGDLELIDSEVTGYIVSLLLPVIAASKPATADWLAYGACALLILLVAFAAELWAVNPITYFFGLRAARAVVDGRSRVVLVRGALVRAGQLPVVSRLGVTLILPSQGCPPTKIETAQDTTL